MPLQDSALLQPSESSSSRGTCVGRVRERERGGRLKRDAVKSSVGAGGGQGGE